MSDTKIIQRLLRQVSDSLFPPAQDLHGPQELKQAIQRERSRADRTHDQFAVISFASEESPSDRRALLPLVTYLKTRSRSTDDLGWNRDNQLWLVLPHCSAESAAKLGADLCLRFSTETGKLAYTLYHYASQEPGRGVPDQIDALDPTLRAPGNPAPLDPGPSPLPGSHGMEQLFVRDMPLWKRLIDVAGATAGLLLLSPLMLSAAIAVKLSSPGPIFFGQLRRGRGGQPFLLYKFRSMAQDAEQRKAELLAKNEQDGPAFKMEFDPRVTRVGRILRAFSIDELPQLWNVLRGEMSLVGPRPLPVAEADACNPWQRQRLDVTPGLTCFWQVKDRRSKIPFVDWARMDINYAGRRSALLDFRLILQTILFVIRRKGV